MLSRCIQTPTGPIVLTERDGALIRVTWQSSADADQSALLRDASDQIDAYFAHQLTAFSIPLRVDGSETQKAICDAMSAIPFGETRRYKDIALALGLPPQAIGQGCGANPIPLIIPCHRVLSSTGLGGFSGGSGIETKVALLKHEGAASLLI